MSRRSNAGIDTRKSDPIYRNRLVNMMVNRILRDGKKSISYEILYRAMERIERTTGKNPLSILRQAVRAVAPNVVVGARRIGGSTYQIPVEIEPVQGKALAIRWILVASRKRSGRGMASKLGSELMDAARNSGSAVRKREETHKMAESNRAFSHFR